MNSLLMPKQVFSIFTRLIYKAYRASIILELTFYPLPLQSRHSYRYGSIKSFSEFV
jgi:hypothetical protein